MRTLLPGLLLLLAPPAPDVLLPGHVTTRHEVVLTWDDALPVRFVASPVQGLHGNHAITRGEPFRFSSKYGTRIYALPADAPWPAAEDTLRDSAWPSQGVPVREVASLPQGHPVARLTTTLRVTALRADGFDLEVVAEERFTQSGLPVAGPLWLPLALIAGLGIVLLVRWRPTAPAEPPA